jgi:glutaredoxin
MAKKAVKKATEGSKKTAKPVPFHVISKPGCTKCESLKEWLTENNVKFEEWSLADEDVKQKLITDEKFTEKFCDVDGCMVYTPVIRLDDSGEYYFKELFNQSGLREDAVKKLLNLK